MANYNSSYKGSQIDSAVGKALNPDSSADASHTTNLITSAAVANGLAGKYTKPSGGIPATDLASGVIPTVPTATTTTPKMDSTAAVGSETKWAKGDHVHPTDTSRAPTNHASSANTYGVGNNNNYGHLRLNSSTSSTAGSTDGYAATPAAVKEAYDLAASKLIASTTPLSVLKGSGSPSGSVEVVLPSAVPCLVTVVSALSSVRLLGVYMVLSRHGTAQHVWNISKFSNNSNYSYDTYVDLQPKNADSKITLTIHSNASYNNDATIYVIPLVR